MKIAVLTDTNSGITVEEGIKYGISVLSMPVLIDERCYLEGVDIEIEQLYEAMKKECRISTSQPSPGSVMEMWNSPLRAGYDQIVHIPMTSGLSGSCHNAKLLAENFQEKVYVADNHRISVTQRESVLEAKRMADAGYWAEEIRDYLEASAFQSSIYLTVSSLDYLKRGGRLSSTSAMLGTVLNVKPILSIQGEKIDAFPDMPVYYSPLPCSIACHVSPDCRGIAVSVVKY